MPRHRAADPRQDVAEIPEVERPHGGHAGRPNSRIASRPPGRSTRSNSAHATSGCCTLRMPNAIVDRIAPTRRRPAAASRRRAPAAPGRRATGARTLMTPCASIAPAKSTPTTRAAPRRRAARRAIATSAVPVQTSSSRSRPVSPASESRGAASSDRARPTAPCSAGRSAPRSRRTCPRSSRGDLSRTDIQRQRRRQEIQDAHVAVEIEGALHLREIVCTRPATARRPAAPRPARRRRGRSAPSGTQPAERRHADDGRRRASAREITASARCRSAPESSAGPARDRTPGPGRHRGCRSRPPTARSPGRAATARRRRVPPAASQPPTGATAIARPRNACV